MAPDLAHGSWRDEHLLAAVDLVKRLHDVLALTALAGGEETVCHNDLGPCNTVHVDAIPHAFIDWDGRRPGLASSTSGTPCGGGPSSPTRTSFRSRNRCGACGLMLDAYGGVDGGALLDAIAANQDRVVYAADARGDSASGAWHCGERAWFAAHRDIFGRGVRPRRPRSGKATRLTARPLGIGQHAEWLATPLQSLPMSRNPETHLDHGNVIDGGRPVIYYSALAYRLAGATGLVVVCALLAYGIVQGQPVNIAAGFAVLVVVDRQPRQRP